MKLTDEQSALVSCHVFVQSPMAAVAHPRPQIIALTAIPFYARKQLCFQRVLAIAILSVCPSVRHRGGLGKNGPS